MSRDREAAVPMPAISRSALNNYGTAGLTDAPVENRRKTRRKRPCT